MKQELTFSLIQISLHNKLALKPWLRDNKNPTMMECITWEKSLLFGGASASNHNDKFNHHTDSSSFFFSTVLLWDILQTPKLHEESWSSCRPLVGWPAGWTDCRNPEQKRWNKLDHRKWQKKNNLNIYNADTCVFCERKESSKTFRLLSKWLVWLLLPVWRCTPDKERFPPVTRDKTTHHIYHHDHYNRNIVLWLIGHSGQSYLGSVISCFNLKWHASYDWWDNRPNVNATEACRGH